MNDETLTRFMVDEGVNEYLYPLTLFLYTILKTMSILFNIFFVITLAVSKVHLLRSVCI